MREALLLLSINYESYWFEDKQHRPSSSPNKGGPAVIHYDPDGSIEYYEYWVDDIRYRKKNIHNYKLETNS